MRVVFFGAGEFAVPSLRWLGNSAHELPLVVTQPDRPAGRGKQATPTMVAQRALQDGLPLERCEDVNAPAFIERVRELRPDLAIAIAFGQKLLEPLRSVFAQGCINLHASLLPKYRGAAPINWAILQGERRTGVTAFKLVDRMDAGPILVKRETMIGPDETAGELHDRLAGVACDALGATLKLYEGGRVPEGTPQDESEATKAPKLSKLDGLIRFTDSAEQICRRCRAMWPWPGARCRYVSGDGKSEEVMIAAAAVVPAPANVPPGTISDVLTVATTDGSLEIHSIQPAGKRVMSWQDFVNGRHVKPGERMEAM
jgi:methionyl-tRNA formyltransferase